MIGKIRATQEIAYNTFGWALDVLKSGGSVMRDGWNGKGQYVQLQRPDITSKMSLPYFYIVTVSGERVPWVPSQTDLLAEDWRIV